MEPQMQQFATDLIGKWGWLFLAGGAFLLFRSTMESLVAGLMTFMGKDLNTDDVIVFDGRPARVTRVGIWKTIIYVYDIERGKDGKPWISGGNKRVVMNAKLADHDIEKPLTQIDLSRWKNGFE